MNWLAIPETVWVALPFAGGVLAIIAGALLALGLRGRSDGWHPACRRCRHDLRSLNPETRKCPECGADLTRRGAVAAGTRRVAPLMLAIGIAVLSLAGYTMWRLQEPKVNALRLQLVSQMSTDDLVAAVFDNHAEPPPTAVSALQLRIEDTPARPRTVPSGELLASLLHAIARSAETGHPNVREALPSPRVRWIIRWFDDEELLHLAEHAAQEVIDSGGTRRALLEALIDAATNSPRRGGQMHERQSKVMTHLTEVLRQTPEGQELLKPRLRAVGPAPEGGPLVLETYTPLDLPKPRRFGRTYDGGDPQDLRFIAERAHLVNDSQRTLLPLRTSSTSDRTIALLAELPVGPAQIDVYGVHLPGAAVPARSLADPSQPFTFEQARAIEGAEPVVHRVNVVITAPAAPQRSRAPATDVAQIERFASLLRRLRFSTDMLGQRVDITDMLWSDTTSPIPWFAFRATVVQGDHSHDLGHVAGRTNNVSGGIGPLPGNIDPQSPFDIVMVPDMTVADGYLRTHDANQTMATDGLLWARFTLQYRNTSTAPTVTGEALPISAAQPIPIDTPSVRADLQSYGSKLVNIMATDRRNHPHLWLPPSMSAGETAPKLPVLCGHFEARSGGRLIAARATWIGYLNENRRSMPFHTIANVPNDQPITVRYLPDPAIITAFWPGSFEYLAVPFEFHLDPVNFRATLVMDSESDAATSAATPQE